MENNFYVKGFKCFGGDEFKLNSITVLTGNNGTGKSSLIQALLLIRLAIERNVQKTFSSDYTGTTWLSVPVPLDLQYELSLGSNTDIFNENETGTANIIFRLDDESFTIQLPDEKSNKTSVNVSLENKTANKQSFPFWRKKEFYYLYTERLGPRLSLTSNYTEFTHCGYKGEYTAQVLLNSAFFKVDSQRHFINSKSDFLPQQVDLWLDYICPGTTVRVEQLGSMSAQIRLRNNSTKNPILATNIGFGISYALPVIVTGLIAEKGSVFIVENPEAHLHPKGQSNIGFFLAIIAASGVKVIVETHSEHVVNGIRRTALSENLLKPEDVNIYFFHEFEKESHKITKINIASNGDLSDFPLDFFDQNRQDLLQIINLSKR